MGKTFWPGQVARIDFDLAQVSLGIHSDIQRFTSDKQPILPLCLL